MNTLAINLEETGLTVYAILRQGSTAWDVSGEEMVTYTSTRATFALPLAEVGTTGLYAADWPAPAGYYTWEFVVQTGGSPSHADDFVVATAHGYRVGADLGADPIIDSGLRVVLGSEQDLRDDSILAYQFTTFRPRPFIFYEADGTTPADLSDKTFSFVVWSVKGTKLFELTNVTKLANVVTPVADASNMQVAGDYRFTLWETATKDIYARGKLTIAPEMAPAA